MLGVKLRAGKSDIPCFAPSLKLQRRFNGSAFVLTATDQDLHVNRLETREASYGLNLRVEITETRRLADKGLHTSQSHLEKHNAAMECASAKTEAYKFEWLFTFAVKGINLEGDQPMLAAVANRGSLMRSFGISVVS